MGKWKSTIEAGKKFAKTTETKIETNQTQNIDPYARIKRLIENISAQYAAEKKTFEQVLGSFGEGNLKSRGDKIIKDFSQENKNSLEQLKNSFEQDDKKIIAKREPSLFHSNFESGPLIMKTLEIKHRKAQDH